MKNFNIYLLNLIIIIISLIWNFDCQQTNFNGVVGEVDYKAEVVKGETIVSIPIPKLKGLNGLVPEIELTYRSNQFSINKELGLGWSLNGLSEITRCFKTVTHDDQYNNIKYDLTDRFCYDGQRLILVNGTYGEDRSEYKTETDNFNKIILYRSFSIKSPKYFKVFTKTNLILTFDGVGSKVIGSGPSSCGLIGNISVCTTDFVFYKIYKKWVLTKIEDYNGNEINFEYMKLIPDYFLIQHDFKGYYNFLKTIKYSNRIITFDYIERNDIQKKFYNNELDYEISKLLKSVALSVYDSTLNQTIELKRLELEYGSYEPSKLSILKQVKLCYSDRSCTRPLMFSYDGINGVQESLPFVQYHNNICDFDSICELTQMIDMNGDGRLDLVGFGSNGVYVSLNMGSYFNKSEIWSSEFSKSSGWNTNEHFRYISDVNSDGLPDIVGFGNNGVFVSLNLKDNFKSMEKWHDQFGFWSSAGGWTVELNFHEAIHMP